MSWDQVRTIIFTCCFSLRLFQQEANSPFSSRVNRGDVGFHHTALDEGMTPSDTTIDYKVSSFQINLLSRFENKLLHNDLIIFRNHGDDEEDVGEEFGGVVDQ